MRPLTLGQTPIRVVHLDGARHLTSKYRTIQALRVWMLVFRLLAPNVTFLVSAQQIRHLSGRASAPAVSRFAPVRHGWQRFSARGSRCIAHNLPIRRRSLAGRWRSRFVQMTWRRRSFREPHDSDRSQIQSRPHCGERARQLLSNNNEWHTRAHERAPLGGRPKCAMLALCAGVS